MAQNTIKSRMSQKHDIEANWLKATCFIPLAGEIIVYDPDESHSTPRFKIGNGTNSVNDLPFQAQVKFLNKKYECTINAIDELKSVWEDGMVVSSPEIYDYLNFSNGNHNLWVNGKDLGKAEIDDSSGGFTEFIYRNGDTEVVFTSGHELGSWNATLSDDVLANGSALFEVKNEGIADTLIPGENVSFDFNEETGELTISADVPDIDTSNLATKEEVNALDEKFTPATYTSRYNDFLITPKGSAHLDEATEPAIGSGSGWHRVHIGQRRAPGTLDISLMHRYWGPAVQNLSLKFSGFVDWPENNNTGKIKPTMYQFYNCYYGPEAYDANDVHAKITKARLGWGDPTATDAIANPMLCYVDVYVELDDTQYKTKYDATKTKSPAAQCEIGLTAIFYGDANKSGTYPILSEKESIYHTIDGVDYNINEYGAKGEKLTFHEIEIDFENDISLENLGANKVTAEVFNLKKDELVGLNYFGNLEQVAPSGSFELLETPENAVSSLGAFYHKFNMLPYPQYVTDRNGLNGLYVDVDRSGALIIHGTPTANTFKPLNAYNGNVGIDVRSDKSFFLPVGTYKVSKYLEFQMVYEHDTSTLINNPHTNGSNSFMPTTDTTTMSTFTVDAPGAWVTRTGLRFTKGKTYNNVIFTPFIYPATEDFSIVGDVGFITIQDRKADKLYLIEDHKDFYGDTFKIEDTNRMNEIFNRSNHSTLMIRALEQNDIVLHGETSLTVSGAGSDIDLSKYAKKEELEPLAKKEEVSNALIQSEKNIGIKLDVNPLSSATDIGVSAYYCFKPTRFIHDSEDQVAYSITYHSDLEFDTPYPIVYIGKQLVDPDLTDDWYKWEYVLLTNKGYKTMTITPEGPGMEVNPFGLKSGDVIMYVRQSNSISYEVGHLTSMYLCEPDLGHSENNKPAANASIVKYGKNILDVSDIIEYTDEFDGVTVHQFSDGRVKLDGTASADFGYTITMVVGSPNALPSGTYITVSGGLSNNCYLELHEEESTEMSLERPSNIYYDYGNGATFLVPYDNGVYHLNLHVKQNTIFNNVIIYPQIEVGNKKTSWEAPKAPKTYTTNEEGKVTVPTEGYETVTLLSNWDACLHTVYNRNVNAAFEEQKASINNVDNVLRQILAILQEGGLTSNQAGAIEQLLVSYLEDKTVKEVEE